MIEAPITGQPFSHGAILAFRNGETVEILHRGRDSILSVDNDGNIGWNAISRLPKGDELTTFTSLSDVRPKKYENTANLPITVVSGNKIDFGNLVLRSLDDVSDSLQIGSNRVLVFNGQEWSSSKIGADVLNDLQDVDVTLVPLRDQFLAFGSLKWLNSDSFDGGSF